MASSKYLRRRIVVAALLVLAIALAVAFANRGQLRGVYDQLLG
ncbi:MAG: hypothetical protein RJA30_195, partial [Actinomycetota bacterium]